MAHLDHGDAELLEELGLILGVELNELHGVSGIQELGIGVKDGPLGQYVLEVGIVEQILGDEV